MERSRDVSNCEDKNSKLHVSEGESCQSGDFSNIILDSIAAMVMVLDKRGHIICFNRACEILTGYTLSEVKGRNIIDFLIPEEGLETARIFFQAGEGGILQDSFNGPVLTRFGEHRPISWKNSIRIDESGAVTHIIATGIDITSMQLVKEELQRTFQTQGVLNDLLHLTLEDISLPEILQRFIHHLTSLPWLMIEPQGAVFVMDDDSGTLELLAERNLAPQLLKSCARISLGTCLCGRAAAKGEIIFADCIDDDHDVRFEGMRPHGHYCVPIMSGTKKLLGVFTLYVKEHSVRDRQAEEIFSAAASVVAAIIERKRAEDALLESEERYRVITDTASDSIIMMDDDDSITFWNPAATRMFGYSAHEALGKSFRSFLDLPSYEEATDRKKATAFLKNGDMADAENEMMGVRNDGSRFPVEVSLAKFKTDKGWGGVAIIRDNTRRKEAEKERIRLEARFLQAQKMEAVGQLAGGVAHDFNNLLTGIIGFAEIALDDVEENSTLHEDISEIVELSQKASKLTRQLLAFSRRQSLIPEELSLNNLVSHMLKMLKRLIGEQIKLSFTGDSDLATVFADPGQIEQILANLTVNARDAMPDGGKLIITTTNVTISNGYNRIDGRHEEIPPGEYVHLSVKDTGFGMTEEVASQIFEPFFSTKEMGKGSGLGLSTVYGIVKQHHGAILIDSTPGKGSVFTVFLPKADVVDRNEISSLPQGMPAVQGSGRVLVVEDEESVRKVARRILEKLGYDVMVAEGAEEAERIFLQANGAIDLLLTDVIMPGKNGKELHDSLVKKYPDLKVLYMSGYMDDVLAQKGVLGPDCSFIKKPFSSQAIAEKINSMLG